MSIEHWIWLSELDTDRKSKYLLAKIFGNAERVYTATASELEEMKFSKSLTDIIARSRTLDKAARIALYCRRHNINIININDAGYPERLENIDVPPVVLYTLGRMHDFDRLPTLGVIGSRKVSDSEKALARQFSCRLAREGMMIVSGMALGIDGMSNMGAMDAGMSTAAVLGSGVDVCYPEQNRRIYERILSTGGCIISEYPPGGRPKAEHFPERNRIISGLSMGVLVIAAPERSGSLITAGCALEQGRDIFVIPGGIDNPMFTGSNQLIKDGAVPVTEPEDIISEYRARYPQLFDEPPRRSSWKEYTHEQIPETAAAVQTGPQEQEKPRAVVQTVQKPEILGSAEPKDGSIAIKDYDYSRVPKNRHSKRGKKYLGLFNRRSSDTSETVSAEAAVKTAEPPAEPDMTAFERRIYDAVGRKGRSFDDIADVLKADAGELAVTISAMTLKGIVEEFPGRYYKIKR